MMGLGWAEILLILAIALFVIGPQDIPKVMYGVGRFVRRLQYVRFAISQQFDDILKAGDIEELRRGVNFETAKTDEQGADAEMLPDLMPSSTQTERQHANNIPDAAAKRKDVGDMT